MRLFIAVNFDEDIKSRLFDTILDIQSCAKQGNFTRRENLHLTLVFIGETSRPQDIKRIMDKLDFKSFNFIISGLGSFKRSRGDIYWFSVCEDEMLRSIHNQLHKHLTLAGFQLENRKFTPHLTIGREVILGGNFDLNSFSETLKNIDVRVSKISLMQSQRINGKLVYKEIYSIG